MRNRNLSVIIRIGCFRFSSRFDRNERRKKKRETVEKDRWRISLKFIPAETNYSPFRRDGKNENLLEFLILYRNNIALSPRTRLKNRPSVEYLNSSRLKLFFHSSARCHALRYLSHPTIAWRREGRDASYDAYHVAHPPQRINNFVSRCSH